MVTQENHDSVRWTIWEYKRVRPLVVANRKWNGTNSNSLGASGLNWLVTWPKGVTIGRSESTRLNSSHSSPSRMPSSA